MVHRARRLPRPRSHQDGRISGRSGPRPSVPVWIAVGRLAARPVDHPPALGATHGVGGGGAPGALPRRPARGSSRKGPGQGHGLEQARPRFRQRTQVEGLGHCRGHHLLTPPRRHRRTGAPARGRSRPARRAAGRTRTAGLDRANRWARPRRSSTSRIPAQVPRQLVLGVGRALEAVADDEERVPHAPVAQIGRHVHPDLSVTSPARTRYLSGRRRRSEGSARQVSGRQVGRGLRGWGTA